jgi:hypothetical protein
MHRPKRPAIVALVLTAIVAGGVAVSSAYAAGAALVQEHWRVLTLPVPRNAPVSFAEPGIAFGPDGSAVANAATANTGAPPTFWISRDGGSAWATGRDFDTTGASTGDADAAIGADGYFYALNLGYNPTRPGSRRIPPCSCFARATAASGPVPPRSRLRTGPISPTGHG